MVILLLQLLLGRLLSGFNNPNISEQFNLLLHLTSTVPVLQIRSLLHIFNIPDKDSLLLKAVHKSRHEKAKIEVFLICYEYGFKIDL